MAIKVQFPAGESNVTVRGLYQWDYGQVLEIECEEFGSDMLEFHFACPNMSEAIVRTCTFSANIGTVPIPDECLEQTSSVTVWICRRDSTQRHTIKTIVLPLTGRTRPGNMLDDIPAVQKDAVGQLMEEINEAVNALENGNVAVAKASHANTAGHATTAGSATNATNATYATAAGSASAISLKEKFYDNVTVEGISVSLEYGKTYLISAGVLNQDDDARTTFVLYIANKGDNFDSDGIIVDSTASAGGIYIRAYFNSQEIRFFDKSNAPASAHSVTIREI